MPAKKSPATYLFGKVAVSLLILVAFQHVSAQFGLRNTRPAIPDLFNSGFNSGLDARQSCSYSPVKQLTSLTPTEYDTLRLYATYYSVRNGLSSTLMLNNKGAESIQANPTFYSLAGTRLQIDPIIVPAASYIEVDMRQLLLNAGDEFREGSLNISYQGRAFAARSTGSPCRSTARTDLGRTDGVHHEIHFEFARKRLVAADRER